MLANNPFDEKHCKIGYNSNTKHLENGNLEHSYALLNNHYGLLRDKFENVIKLNFFFAKCDNYELYMSSH